MGEEVKLLVEGGNASPAPPLGPALAPIEWLDLGEVVSKINESTQDFEGMEVPVTVKVDEETNDFEIEVGTPPVAAMLKRETELDTLSAHPRDEKVADIFIEQCIKIAKSKMPDLNSPTLKSSVKQVVGSCASSGVLVEGKEPEEVIKEIDQGKYDEKIKNEKTELSEEKRKKLREKKEELQEEVEEMEEKWREKAEKMLKEMEEEVEEEEEEELSRDEKVERLKGEDIPYEIIVEFLPEEEEEEGEEEEGEGETEDEGG